MLNISISDIIIAIFFFIIAVFVMRWLSDIDRKIKREEFIKKYYSYLSKKEQEEQEDKSEKP